MKPAVSDSFTTRLTDAAAKSIPEGISSILVGLSGGADSVALLKTLVTLKASSRRFANLRIMAVHCNFHLRGQESLRDERFCRELATALGVELEVIGWDTEEIRRQRGGSLEMVCRDLRYGHFRKLMREGGWQRTAVAHHADDNAETLLLNLMRGAGCRGLKGMVADTGEILRPFLKVRHEEILKGLEQWGLEYIVDSSNLSDDFSRNFIRLKVIPLLETRWPGALEAISRSQENLGRESALIDRMMDESAEGDRLPLGSVRNCGDPLTLVLRFISPHGGSPLQAREILRSILAEGFQSGKWWRLASGKRLSLERKYLEILPGEVSLRRIGCERLAMSEELKTRILAGADPGTAYFPRPLSEYMVRGYREGDRMRCMGGRGTTLLSKLMKDAGMSRRQKEEMPVVCDPRSGEILWAAGLRRGAADPLSFDAPEAYRLKLL